MPGSQRAVGALRRAARIVAREFTRTRRVIVTEGDRPSTERPIFVIGAHRSGTTLVRLVLDSHSRIGCPPESFFLLPLSKVLFDDKSTEGLTAMGFPRRAQLERLRAFASFFFEAYLAARGKQRWADKTPPYVDCLDFIEELYGPQCQYLFVYRHGLDVASSVAQMRIREVQPHVEACGGDRHRGAARYWATQCRKMMEFRKSLRGRCLEIRYEDLATSPEEIVRKLFEFLGEQWEPEVLRFHEHKHDRWIGLEDGKASESTGFSPNIGAWRKQPSDIVERMLGEAGDVLKDLGYGTDVR